MLRFSALERLACLFTVYMQKCDYYYDYNSVFPTLPPQTCLSQFGFLCWRTDPTCLIRIFSTCREKYGCKCELLFRSLVLEFWTFVNEFLVLDPAQFESLMLQTICCIWLIKIKIFNQLWWHSPVSRLFTSFLMTMFVQTTDRPCCTYRWV